MTILCFAGSLRQESSNKKLAREAARLLAAHARDDAQFLDLGDFPMVLYDGDVETSGLPASASRLGARIAAATALVIATPEYNGGITGVLKNTVDWLSRLQPMPLRGKHLLLLGASPGPWGGIRGLWHSRVPFEALGVHVFPQMLSIAACHTAFDHGDRLTGDKEEQLARLLAAFAAHARASAERRAA